MAKPGMIVEVLESEIAKLGHAMVRGAADGVRLRKELTKTLANFNTEEARGIMHTPEYVKQMEELQAYYNEKLYEEKKEWQP